MKRCLSPLPKRKMQFKTLVKYNPIRMALKKKKLLIPSGHGATGTLISVGMQNNRTTLGKNLTGSQKLNINLPLSPTIPFLRIYHYVDYSPQAKFSSDPNSTRHISFCIVSGCFQTTVELNTCNKDCIAYKAKIFINTIHPFTEKVCQHLSQKKELQLSQNADVQSNYL